MTNVQDYAKFKPLRTKKSIRNTTDEDPVFRVLAAAFSRECFLQPSLNCPNLGAVKQKVTPEFEVLEGRCAGPEVCPLSHVKAGAVVCIRQLATAPEVTSRLRELGFCEDQKIRLVARQSNYICQVCNARLAISGRLADSIMVEAVPAPVPKD
jgi:Fe2+ transport system protein FeoA